MARNLPVIIKPEVLVKAGWGNKEALIYNLAIDDGHGLLGGRRFNKVVGMKNDPQYPWVTWIIFKKIQGFAS